MSIESLNLVDDVLVKIFSYLDARSLKFAVLVCKNWNNLIGSSSQCSFKLHLKDDFSLSPRVLWEDKLNEILLIRRKFSAIKCVSPSTYIDRTKVDLFTKVVKNFGENVTNLNIQFFNFKNLSKFKTILNNLPRMEEFILRFCGVTSKVYDQQPILLPKLKFLIFEGCDPQLLEAFTPTNLKSLEVSKVYKGSKAILNFLLACPKLETILCRDLCSFKIMFPYKITQTKKNSHNYPFRLKTLTVYGEKYDELASHNVVVLFKSQGKHLQELFVDVLIDPIILRKIFTNLKKLKILSVSACETENFDESFYDDFKPLYKLRTLKIDGANEDCLRAVLKNSPKLNELVAKDLCCLNMVTEFSKNIKKLRLQRFDDPTTKFVNLEELFVDSLLNHETLIKFFVNNSKIKTLGICSFDESQLVMLEDIMSQLKICHLKVECSARTGKQVYEKFKKNHGNLRSLSIQFFTRINEESYFYRKKLIKKQIDFKFPKEKSQFKMKCNFFDNFVVDNDKQ